MKARILVIIALMLFPQAVSRGATVSKGLLFGRPVRMVTSLPRNRMLASLHRVSTATGIPTGNLVAVLFVESGMDGRAVNMAGTRAVGVAQFMPHTLHGLGETPRHVAGLHESDQVLLFGRYLTREMATHGRIRNLTDLYMAMLYPAARERYHRGNDTIFKAESVAYEANPQLDTNQDGVVMAGELLPRIRGLCKQRILIK